MRPLVIAVAALKGGVGKSTIAINLASALHLAGHRTLLVDTDPQGTARDWAAVAAEQGADTPPVVAMGREIARDLERIAEGWRVVVIDVPPRHDVEQRAAMLVSRLVLVPVTPGAADVWALQKTLALLEEARAIRPALQAAIVLNRVKAHTTIAGIARDAVQTAGLVVLETALADRVAFGEAVAMGQGVLTYEPGGKAAAELAALAREVLSLVE